MKPTFYPDILVSLAPVLHRAARLLTVLFAGSAMAQPTITNLGVLSGASDPYSFAFAISADGLVVTGSSGTSAGERAFRWTAGGGMVSLGILPGYNRSYGYALSADGAVIAGGNERPPYDGPAFRWTAATGMQSLGILENGAASYANDISADGSVIVGLSYINDRGGISAFRWTAATGIEKLNINAPRQSVAYGVSADGLVVVGTGLVGDDGFTFRWTAAGGSQRLNLSSGAIDAIPAISDDGLVVAGMVVDSSDNFHAFRSTGFAGGGGGVMQDLGVLDGGTVSSAFALNGDGSALVGYCSVPLGQRAILWTPTLGMVDLNRYLPARGVNLTGWTLEDARGISADGSAIVGYGKFNGSYRAFLVRGLTGLGAQAPGAPLLTAFTNPSPANPDLFGTAVAALGSDRVLVGAEGAGAAYLFASGGNLLTTFTNPNPAVANRFGVSLAAVGNDRIVIGADRDNTGAAEAGVAYLFSTDGTLLKTLANPSPVAGDWFGQSVAAVGSDRILIGASDSKHSHKGGAAYLFDTSGALLTTFTNPAPTSGDSFGWSVAGMGADRVIIGARYGASGSGVAYLFSTSGQLLKTLPNPAPAAADNFGVSVAGVGSDRLLIGAVDNAVGRNGGAAYLFGTDGTLLTTFKNPTPAPFDYFGWSVAAVGNSRVLIGAYQDYAAVPRAGSAHLFATDGTLLHTFTRPTPAAADNFGVSVAAVGKDRVVIGALGDDTGATDSGAAFLFGLPYPPLGIALESKTVSLKWTSHETGLILEQSESMGDPASWRDAGEAVSVEGLTNVVHQSVANGPQSRFYRLRRP